MGLTVMMIGAPLHRYQAQICSTAICLGRGTSNNLHSGCMVHTDTLTGWSVKTEGISSYYQAIQIIAKDGNHHNHGADAHHSNRCARGSCKPYASRIVAQTVLSPRDYPYGSITRHAPIAQSDMLSSKEICQEA